jgi:nucleoside-diphosphate-sugar epimerase
LWSPRISGAIIVCGAGRIGSGVIDLLLALGKRLVVVEISPDSSLVEQAREQHLDLLTGDATLDLCNLGAAHALVALTKRRYPQSGDRSRRACRNPTMPVVLRIAEASFAQRNRRRDCFLYSQ